MFLDSLFLCNTLLIKKGDTPSRDNSSGSSGTYLCRFTYLINMEFLFVISYPYCKTVSRNKV